MVSDAVVAIYYVILFFVVTIRFCSNELQTNKTNLCRKNSVAVYSLMHRDE